MVNKTKLSDLLRDQMGLKDNFAVSQEKIVYSEEGAQGAVGAFLATLGIAGLIGFAAFVNLGMAPVVIAGLGVAGLLGLMQKAGDKHLQAKIKEAAQELADLRNHEISAARLAGIEVEGAAAEKMTAKEILTSFAMGAALPGLYQGYNRHLLDKKSEELEKLLKDFGKTLKDTKVKLEVSKESYELSDDELTAIISQESEQDDVPAAADAAVETGEVDSAVAAAIAEVEGTAAAPGEDNAGAPTAEEAAAQAQQAAADAQEAAAKAAEAAQQAADAAQGEGSVAADTAEAPADAVTDATADTVVEDAPASEPVADAPASDAPNADVAATDDAAPVEAAVEPAADEPAAVTDDATATVADEVSEPAAATDTAVVDEASPVDEAPPADPTPDAAPVADTPATDDATGAVAAAKDAIAEAASATDDAAPAATDAAADTTAPAEPATDATVEPAADASVDATDAGDASAFDTIEDSSEFDEIDQAHSELSEAHAGLESIMDSIESSLKQGGLTPQSARFANLAIESYTDRLGLSTDTLPSFESYGAASSREAVSMESMESVKKMIEKVLAALKMLVAKAKVIFKQFMTKVVSGAAFLKKKNEELKKKLVAVGNKLQGKDVTLTANQFMRLNIGGEVDLIGGSKNISKIIQGILADVSENLKTANHSRELTQKILTAKSPEEFDARSDEMLNALKSSIKTNNLFSRNLPAEGGLKLFGTEMLPGNVYFVCGGANPDEAKTGIKGIVEFINSTMIDARAGEAVDARDDYAVKSVDANTAKELLTNVDLLSKEIDDIVSALPQMEEMVEKTEEVAKYFQEATAEAIGNVRSKMVSQLITASFHQGQKQLQGIRKVLLYVAMRSKLYLEFVEKAVEETSEAPAEAAAA